MKKILIIAHSFTADTDPRGFRWYSVSEELIRRGYEVDVVSPKVWKSDSIKGSMRVFHPCFRFDTILGRKCVPNVSVSLHSNCWWLLSALLRRTWRKICWPDNTAMWILPGFLCSVCLLMKYRYSAVITVAWPFSSHVIGLLLKPFIRRSVWIADYGDPFFVETFKPDNNLRLFARINWRADAAVSRKAHAICVATEETKKLYENAFHVANKIIVTPSLVEVPQRFLGERKQPTSAMKKMLYTGTIHGLARRCEPFFWCLNKLFAEKGNLNLEVHFFGDVSKIGADLAGIGPLIHKNVFFHGIVSRERVRAEIAASDVLANIGNLSSYQMPSKILEYVAFGKPIINFTCNPRDLVASFLDDYPAFLNCFCENEDTAGSCVKKLLDFLQTEHRVPASYIDQKLRSFRLSSIADQYERLFREPRT